MPAPAEDHLLQQQQREEEQEELKRPLLDQIKRKDPPSHGETVEEVKRDEGVGEGKEKEKQQQQEPKRRKKPRETFIYGNYRTYYGYRIDHGMKEDPRLATFEREWFEGKDCLDIGCNEGFITINIAKKFFCRSILGIDIDAGLIETAHWNLRKIAKMEISKSQEFLPTDDVFKRISFLRENFVESSRGCSEMYDTIVCLSVTKWIHLNWGDDGLINMFVKIWRLLRPGGVLVLEPQPWSSYKRYYSLSETLKKNYYDSRIRPDDFREILLDKIGFRSAEIITNSLSGAVAGFGRPIIVFTK